MNERCLGKAARRKKIEKRENGSIKIEKNTEEKPFLAESQKNKSVN